jgi:hypothetical protein
VHPSADGTQTVIGPNGRDHAWSTAWTPAVPDDRAKIVAELAAQGRDLSRLRKVPEPWSGG